MNDNEIICPCLDLSVADIKEAISNGSTSVDEIIEATGAGSVCGVCIDEVKELAEKLLGE